MIEKVEVIIVYYETFTVKLLHFIKKMDKILTSKNCVSQVKLIHKNYR
jgi:hypothetical protein